ncbi:hypothetical protein GN956_G6960 [Arapaima gigas]
MLSNKTGIFKAADGAVLRRTHDQSGWSVPFCIRHHIDGRTKAPPSQGNASDLLRGHFSHSPLLPGNTKPSSFKTNTWKITPHLVEHCILGSWRGRSA